MQLCEPLLALVSLELTPELQLAINHFKSLLVVAREFDLLPELTGQVSPLDGLHEEVALAFLFFDGCVPRIGQGTAVSVAQTCQVVFVSAEGLGRRLALE